MQPVEGRGRLFLLRHGETDWNRARRVMGHRPIPLNDLGRQQIEDLAPHLRGLGVVSIVSSPMVRARETAEIVSKALGGVAVEEDAGLAEVGYAGWEGKTFPELIEDPIYNEFHRDPLGTAPPGGGETLLQVRERVFSAATRALGAAGPCLLVSHGDPLRLLLAACLAIAPEDFRRVRIDNGGLSAIDFSGGWSEAKFVNMRPDLDRMLDAELDGARAVRERAAGNGETE